MSQLVVQRKKRSKYEIVHDLLEQCQNGAKKTWAMYRANLSYDLTNKYLNYLVKYGLVENKDGVYYITDKGKQLLGILKAWKEKKNEFAELTEKIKELLPEEEEPETEEKTKEEHSEEAPKQ